MTYTKKIFGSELQKLILMGKNPVEISKWAFMTYNEHGLEFEKGLDYYVLKLIAIEEGPEFILSMPDLQEIVNQLKN